jgi:tetratricopeptide (TPR) repeat protein
MKQKPLTGVANTVVLTLLAWSGVLAATPAPQKTPATNQATAETCLASPAAPIALECHQVAVRLASEREFGRAIAIEEQVLLLSPGNAEVAAALARMHQDGTRDTVRAIALYHAALDASPGFPAALLGLGTIMADKGEMEVAERYFARGAKERPDLAVFRVRQADALVRLGKGEQARPILKEIVLKWPDSEEAETARKLISRTALAGP